MRISDWSSDGCSSDLAARHKAVTMVGRRRREVMAGGVLDGLCDDDMALRRPPTGKDGKGSSPRRSAAVALIRAAAPIPAAALQAIDHLSQQLLQAGRGLGVFDEIGRAHV